MRTLGVSRATAQRRLRAMVAEGLLRRTTPRGRDVAYVVAPFRKRWRRAAADEHEAWKALEAWLSRALPRFGAEESQTVGYATTELINNAIDHSDATWVSLRASVEEGEAVIVVDDDGVGCFARIRSAHGIATAEDAVAQLEKGKLTSAPDRHAGEGLFFSSKAPRRFLLESGDRAWLVDNDARDSALYPVAPAVRGTRLTLHFVPGRTTGLHALFAAWTDPETLAFAKTRTTIKLAAVGKTLLSRSEAKRVTAGLDRFRHVTLDFAGVDIVGQGFADEVFRIFRRAHPEVELEPVRMNDAVAFMVGRVRQA
jgi:anti-sigma regulatory factor (Ser/Thr protein kinase)